MIKQYKIRDINKNPELHKKVFVEFADALQIFGYFVDKAIECGADEDKMMKAFEEKTGLGDETKD